MKQEIHRKQNERGAALIVALLAMTLLLALGLAVVSSATRDNITTRINRAGEQSFFIADAGIGIARQAFTQALSEEVEKIRQGQAPFFRNSPAQPGQTFPDVQVVPDPDEVNQGGNPFYSAVRARTHEIARQTARAQRFDQLNGSSFEITRLQITGNVLQTPPNNGVMTEVVILRYAIGVTGITKSGGSTSVNETGQISINITLEGGGGDPSRSFKFSGFGAFFDIGDNGGSAALASGIFTGPVHTNTHFAFLSNRNVIFRNVVSQVDDNLRYNNSPRAIPSTDIAGIDISADGYQKIPPVPLPANSFSQEYAVINGTGITDLGADGTPVDKPAVIPTNQQGDPLPILDASGRVTSQALAENLRDASGAKPNVSGNTLSKGVYISSSDGSSISGAGIYVQGDVSDMQVYADTNGDQVYVIRQTQGNSTTTTTIRTSYANNQTSIQTGNGTPRVFSGVFTDKSDASNPRAAASLFVNGGINSLRGGKSGSQNNPAIASRTQLTITADRHITVTGDLKYADPVVRSDGSPVTDVNSITNVLGIFTNNGNLKMEPNTSYVSGPGRSLEIDAAVVTFNSKTSDDSNSVEGSIVYTGTRPGSNDRWKLVGSRVQAKINNIGYSYRDIFFDVRFSGGKFAPPFFPGTSYTLGPPPEPSTVSIQRVDGAAPIAMSWFRD
ncbi:MAG: hypothetical protein AB1631_06840 [Acidobacteriota bacterium]